LRRIDRQRHRCRRPEPGSGRANDRLVRATDAALTEILEGVRNVARTIEEIADASREQTTGVKEVSVTVSQMDEMTQQNAAMADRSAAAALSLTEKSETLVELVRFFTTRDAMGASSKLGAGAKVTAKGDHQAWEHDAMAEVKMARIATPARRPAATANGSWGSSDVYRASPISPQRHSLTAKCVPKTGRVDCPASRRPVRAGAP